MKALRFSAIGLPTGSRTAARESAIGTTRAAWCLVALALLIRVILWKLVYKQPFDDEFIYLHYAQNFAAGHGLVYNAGERIIAFTSPLFMVLESITVWALPVSPEASVQMLNFALFGGACYFLVRLIKPATLWGLVFVGLLLFFYPFVDATLNGMETSLYLGLILATLVLVKEGSPDAPTVGAHPRLSLALIPATLAALTRPEGVFLVLALLIYVFSQSGRWREIRLKHVAFCVLLVLAWVVPAYCYYGTFIPHSMLAKSQFVTGGSWAGQVSSPLQKLAILSLGVSQSAVSESGSLTRTGITVVGCVVFVPFIYCLWKEWMERSVYGLAGLFFLLVLGFYIAGNPVRIWSWYAIPSCFAFLFVACRGLQRWSAGSRGRSFAVGGLLACACLSSFPIGIHSRQRDNTLAAGSPALLALSADTLRAEFPGARSVMVGDVGLMAYRTGMRVIDLAGLVSSGALKSAPDGGLHYLGDYIQSSRPDIICISQDPLKHAEVEQSLMRYRSFASAAQRGWFVNAYAEVRVRQPFFYKHVFVRRCVMPSRAEGSRGL